MLPLQKNHLITHLFKIFCAYLISIRSTKKNMEIYNKTRASVNTHNMLLLENTNKCHKMQYYLDI